MPLPECVSNTFHQTLPTVEEDTKREKKTVKHASVRQSSTNPVPSLDLCPIPAASPQLTKKDVSSNISESKTMNTTLNSEDSAGNTFGKCNNKNISEGANPSPRSKSHSFENLSSLKPVIESNALTTTATAEIDSVADVNKNVNIVQSSKLTRANSKTFSKFSDSSWKKQASSNNISKTLLKHTNSIRSKITNSRMNRKAYVPTNASTRCEKTMPASKVPSTSDGNNDSFSTPVLSRRLTQNDMASGLKKTGLQLQTTPGQPGISKLSFSSVTKRVTTLLRFKRGFLPRTSVNGELEQKPSSPPSESLPSKPRFSAFMSAEAQFALLKGYEDILAQKLVDQYPAEKSLLQRTKTPRHSIAIADGTAKSTQDASLPWTDKKRAWKSIGQFKNEPQNLESFQVNENEKNRNNVEDPQDTAAGKNIDVHDSLIVKEDAAIKKGVRAQVKDNTLTPANYTNLSSEQANVVDNSRASIKQTGAQSSDVSEYLNKINALHAVSGITVVAPVADKNRPSLSMSLSGSSPSVSNDSQTITLALNSTPVTAAQQKRPKARRFSSLPDVGISSQNTQRRLSRDRLLVMTHRMEKAMDILDVLRSNTELALSPRVKGAAIMNNQNLPQQDHQKQQQHLYQSERRLSRCSGAEQVRDFNRWAGQWSLEFRDGSINEV
ncbi:hypothetical protein PoB_003590500 [Plakobranchus ocellatus]|uniref:WASP family protein member n=1 Tax=Plakobranchus ocellatus TaxID=259542 RepID=A0AAV4AMF7_9GAST|nr:hypothetical protein PoB_003590500 [Plakobranchus ocellatus]